LFNPEPGTAARRGGPTALEALIARKTFEIQNFPAALIELLISGACVEYGRNAHPDTPSPLAPG
jgi:hypothetical protein